jgi:hypothetical protein
VTHGVRTGPLLIATALSLTACSGFDPARLSVARDAATQHPAVVFDFVRKETTAGSLYGNRVHFVASGGVGEASFRQVRDDPEVWSLTWADQAGATYEVLLAPRKRGDAPVFELYRDRQDALAQGLPRGDGDLPELGPLLGRYEGAPLRFVLAPDGTLSSE